MNRLEGYCYWQQPPRPDCSFNWSRLCQPPLTQLAFPWQAVQWFADGGSLTLLFLGAVGIPRTWDLRGYTADGLALLTGRTRAYGYRCTEAFYRRSPVPMVPNALLRPSRIGPHSSGVRPRTQEKSNTPPR
jgi:hypothetical protein